MESKLLAAFLRGLDAIGQDVPGVGQALLKALDDGVSIADVYHLPGWWPLIALARHHGLPSRLLDWTRRGLVAAYFAAREAAPRRDQDGELAVWALDREIFSAEATKNERELSIGIVSVPAATNPYLHAQSGVLVAFPPVGPHRPFEDIVKQLAQLHKPGRPVWLHKLLLPWAQAPRLLRLLSYEDITAATMFPGPGGIVDSIKEQGHWDECHSWV